MGKHVLLTAGGLIASVLALAWVQPETKGGAIILAALCILLFNAAGLVVSGLGRLLRGKAKAASPPATEPLQSKVPTLLISLATAGLLVPASLSAQWVCRTPSATCSIPPSTEGNSCSCPRSPGSSPGVAVYGGGGLSPAERLSSQPPTRGFTPPPSVTSGAILGGPAGSDPWSKGTTRSPEPVEADALPGVPLRPARVFARVAGIPPADVGAYGVVALRARPTSASRARLRMVCASFLASLPAQRSLPADVPLRDQMLTVWPLETAGEPGVREADCDHLLDNYEQHGGISAIQDAARQTSSVLAGRGPFLIGWSPSRSRGVRDAVVLVVDMSSFDTQQSFDAAFMFWQGKIVENPALWRSGFSTESMRLAVREFADRYGQPILDAVKLLRTGS